MLPSPANVKLHRTSTTSFEVTWDPPPSYSSRVSGYRVYYSQDANRDLDRWTMMDPGGTHTSAEISGLDQHSAVAVRVRAVATDGRYGNMSEVIVSNGPEYGNYSNGDSTPRCNLIINYIEHKCILTVYQMCSGIK